MIGMTDLYLHLRHQHPRYLERAKELCVRHERERGELRLQQLSEVKALAAEFDDTEIVNLVDRTIPAAVTDMSHAITSLIKSMVRAQ